MQAHGGVMSMNGMEERGVENRAQRQTGKRWCETLRTQRETPTDLLLQAQEEEPCEGWRCAWECCLWPERGWESSEGHLLTGPRCLEEK